MNKKKEKNKDKVKKEAEKIKESAEKKNVEKEDEKNKDKMKKNSKTGACSLITWGIPDVPCGLLFGKINE